MRKDGHIGERFGDGRGVVPAGVIDHDDTVHHALFHDLVKGLHQGFGRVVSRHDHHHFFALIHNLPSVLRGRE